VVRVIPLAILGFALVGCEARTADGQRALTEALGRALPDRPVTDAAAWPSGMLEVEGHFALEDGNGQRWHLALSREARVRTDGAMRIRETRRWRSLERPADGDVREEERWDRFEAVFDGRVWVTRRGEGPWIARDVTDGHHLETLRRIRDWLPELLTAFSSGLSLTPAAEPPDTLAGRPLVWKRVGLAARGASPTLAPEALTALRDDEARWPAWFGATHRVERANGRVASLAAVGSGGAPAPGEAVLGELELGGTASVSGRRATFSASARQKSSPLPADETFDLPATWSPADRPRVWPMIREVLGDRLAPWAGGQTDEPASGASPPGGAEGAVGPGGTRSIGAPESGARPDDPAAD
jgi:hypothetical protein